VAPAKPRYVDNSLFFCVVKPYIFPHSSNRSPVGDDGWKPLKHLAFWLLTIQLDPETSTVYIYIRWSQTPFKDDTVGTYPKFSGTYMHWYNLLSLLWPRCTRFACEQKVHWKLSSRRSPNSWILWQHEMAEGPTTPRRPNVMQTFCLSALMCFRGPNLITTSLNGFNGGFYSLEVRLDINQLWIHKFQ
jgi:hypothetical protein